jgi:hypothetical protein
LDGKNMRTPQDDLAALKAAKDKAEDWQSLAERAVELNKTLLAERDAGKARAEKAEAACAEMRKACYLAWDDILFWIQLAEKTRKELRAATSPDSGKGWLSPERAAELEAENKRLREALLQIKSNSGGHVAGEWAREALAADKEKGSQ